MTLQGHPLLRTSRWRPWKADRRRRGLSWTAAGIFLLCRIASDARGEAASVSREYQIKAAFLFNFTKFVDWPPRTFADENSPIVIGVVGWNPFGDELEKITNGRAVNGRKIQVRVVTTPEGVADVQALFIPAGEENRLRPSSWRNAPVVVVGETAAFEELGGTITFTREADKDRFSINQAAAERAGLKISAQLLKLAADVQRRP